MFPALSVAVTVNERLVTGNVTLAAVREGEVSIGLPFGTVPTQDLRPDPPGSSMQL